MSDADCVALLKWAIPRLGRRWDGYRNVRGQVCKRVRRRATELGLPDLTAYRARLEADPAEWSVLDALCGVTISRFYRDRAIWDALGAEVIPRLAEAALTAGEELRCWSIGCASGEEPYTLSILWELGFMDRYPGVRLRILATDVDAQVLERAKRARYESASLRELPARWQTEAFEARDGSFVLRERFRVAVELRREDLRCAAPAETFRLILCRNVAFTYFDPTKQREALAHLVAHLAEDGALVLGANERLPSPPLLEPWRKGLQIFRRPAALAQ